MFSTLPFGYMFLSVMGAGTLLSLSSIHWLGIWAGLEINLIGFLPMLVYQKSTSESESAVKYFIVQALGSSFLIFGSLMMFNMSFTWDIYNMSSMFSTFGFLVMVSGLCIKLGLFPFHYWLPSVMAGLPWITCLLLATWQKLAPLFLMLCLLELNESYFLVLVLCLISAGSSLIGGVGGMNQTQVRALLAYSSIGHLGWMTFALLHSEWSMKFYLMIYILISACMFTSLWKSDSGNMKNIDNLKSSGFLQMSIMLLLLSLGGLPPLLGFISKWLVILTSTSNPWLSILFLLILGSLMSLFYYLSLFFSVFLSNIKKSGISELKLSESSLLVFIVVMNLMGGIVILTNNLVYIL
uniref:NADH-ubiquinone oxidoreductase chain 2 n=1 Tax=Boreotrophon candelabrum TaxID=2710670 RepID=A0A6C0WXH5_9CAEN|nr:NADH dehydrogenase subunit 2 [Boreotrophon candelabrum]QIC50559.1 NADH dehydrogenase subunit 2 [Boreotrophon candelabrum]